MPVASSLADGLADGLVALGEQGSVSARVEEKLRGYLALLGKWNRVYNLTAITEPEQMITRLVLDSLAIAAPLDALVERRPGARILDAGSGAGLPGIPLAIARPAWQLTLLDSNSKKTAFITQVAAEIGLSNVTIVTARSESSVAAPFDIIVSRAFASLREFVNKTR
ncbi:MAG: 16S rRNA (guanine(527)-N(7))-methyltransferase RsmG, partial [Acidobacteriota bacterium]